MRIFRHQAQAVLRRDVSARCLHYKVKYISVAVKALIVCKFDSIEALCIVVCFQIIVQ